MTRASASAIPSGGVIGILGGGQLGRMTIQAAQALGWRCHVFCPESNSPAEQVADAATVAPYDDHAALATFADAVNVVTYEFENIPLDSIDFLALRRPVRPGRPALEIAQDRIREKAFLNNIPGISTVPYLPVTQAGELAAAAKAVGYPAILKSARYGYDGKGQILISGENELDAAWDSIPTKGGAVLEAFVDFEREISVIIAREISGEARAFDATENNHTHHILDISRTPADIPPPLAEQAGEMARRIAESLGLVGLLAVEMFVSQDGRLLVNEIAPRPHNSGHWTMDACETSQFTQFVLAITGRPLRDPSRHSDADMKNLVGNDFLRRDQIAAPGDIVHIYGKVDVRPGRKMAHINRVRPIDAPAIPFDPV